MITDALEATPPSPVISDFYSGALTICVGIVIAVAVKRINGDGLQVRVEHWFDVLSLAFAMIAAGQSLRGLVTFQQNPLSAVSAFAITLFTAVALSFLIVPFLVHALVGLTEESPPAEDARAGKSSKRRPKKKPDAGNRFDTLPRGYKVVVLAVTSALAVSFLWVPVVEAARWLMSFS